MPDNQSQFLQDCQQQVDKNLHRILDPAAGQPLGDAMIYSVFNGGKRIRPILCYASAQLFGNYTPLTHGSAVAVELIHAYSLIHDDLPAMDDDDLRRGQPTCHIAFDEATAILAGDALQTEAFKTLAQPQDGIHSPLTQLKLINALAVASGSNGMVMGQSQDLEAINSTLTLTELETMHGNKTGALISASVQMGAIASQRASADDLHALDMFSKFIGLAFQITDDIIDIESTTDTLGKRQGADIALNKPTYTSLLGMAGAKQKLQETHQTALDALAHFGKNSSLLQAIANYIVSRNH